MFSDNDYNVGYCSEPLNHNDLRKIAVKNLEGMEPLLQATFEASDDGYALKIALPHIVSASLEVRLANGFLVVDAQRNKIKTTSSTEQHSVERVYSGLEKSFKLPSDADEDTIEATFDHNVLQVTFRKMPSQANKRMLLSKPAMFTDARYRKLQ
jgi:HSP20 family molecular chaperone IbpA